MIVDKTFVLQCYAMGTCTADQLRAFVAYGTLTQAEYDAAIAPAKEA
jgi:hypothetical protein